MSFPEPAPKRYTQEQIRTYNRRFENSFDIFTDPDCTACLTENHPEALSSIREFKDRHKLDPHYNFDLLSGQFRLLRDEVDCTA